MYFGNFGRISCNPGGGMDIGSLCIIERHFNRYDYSSHPKYSYTKDVLEVQLYNIKMHWKAQERIFEHMYKYGRMN